jgi:hypothetical protein
MARDPKYGVTLNGWERLLAAFEANADDFPQLEVYRTQLADMLVQLRGAASQQADLAAGADRGQNVASSSEFFGGVPCAPPFFRTEQ